MGNPSSDCAPAPVNTSCFLASVAAESLLLLTKKTERKAGAQGGIFLAGSTQIFLVWKRNTDALLWLALWLSRCADPQRLPEHSPFLEHPPYLPARSGPRSCSPNSYTDTWQKPVGKVLLQLLAMAPFPCFPSIHCPRSTPGQPLPISCLSIVPRPCSSPLAQTQIGAYLGNAESGVGPPPALAPVTCGLSATGNKVWYKSAEMVSLSLMLLCPVQQLQRELQEVRPV